MVEFTVCADPKDGNDPLKATIFMSIIPDKIEVWPNEGSIDWLTVVDVIACPWETNSDGSGRVELWVESDSYDLDDLKEAMTALAKRGEEQAQERT